MAALLPRKVVCLSCKAKFASAEELATHYKDTHKKEDMLRKKTYVCPMMCGKKFAHKRGLKSHFSNIHSNIEWEDSFYDIIPASEGDELDETEDGQEEGMAVEDNDNGEGRNANGNPRLDIHHDGPNNANDEQQEGRNGGGAPHRDENGDDGVVEQVILQDDDDESEHENAEENILAECREELEELKREKERNARRWRKADRIINDLQDKISKLEERKN